MNVLPPPLTLVGKIHGKHGYDGRLSIECFATSNKIISKGNYLFVVIDGKGVPFCITDVNKTYLEKGKLEVGVLDRGTAWLDTGTFDSLIEAGEFIEVIEKRQGLKIGCIEEIAYRNGWIDDQQMEKLANYYMKSGYGAYLKKLIGNI